MNGIPWRCFGGHEIRALFKRCHLIAALIVSRGDAITESAANALEMIFAIDGDLCAPDRLSKLIENLASKNRVGFEPELEMFGVQVSARNDRGRELIVLIVRGFDETAPLAIERVLSGGNLESEASLVVGNDRLNALPLLCICDGDTGIGERITALRVYDNPGDSVGTGWESACARVRFESVHQCRTRDRLLRLPRTGSIPSSVVSVGLASDTPLHTPHQ